MYEKYFGFADLPFRVTPEPRYFYSNSIYQEALATLRYGIEARKGFIVITGEVGTGKTTLLKLFMQSAESNIHTSFIFNPNFTVTELLRFILKDLGISYSKDDKFTLLEQLNQYLIEQHQQDHIVALLLDEAQNLTDGVLEELRLFSNIETDTHKLIQIVLIGQPELEQRLDHPALRQIKQRVALRCCLDPLEGHEILRYMNFRLKTAGYDGEEIFDSNAVERITLYSTGIPRLINVICDNALRLAYGLSKRKVSGEMIEQVACDLQLSVPRQIPDLRSIDDREHRAPPPSAETQRRESGLEAEAGRFYRGRSPTGLSMGFLLSLVVVAGAVLYLPQNSGHLSVVTAAVGDLVAGQLENLKQAKLIPEASKEASSNPKEPDQVYSVAPVAKKNQPVGPRALKSSEAQLDKPASAAPTLEKPDRQKARRIEAHESEPSQVHSQANAEKEQRIYPGTFQVIGKSLVFDQPQRPSKIVTSLWPGMRIWVDGKTGNYLRVHSLSHPDINGYVGVEDANLQRIDERPRSARAPASQLPGRRSDNFALGPIVKSIMEKLERDFSAGYHPVGEKHQYE